MILISTTLWLRWEPNELTWSRTWCVIDRLHLCYLEVHECIHIIYLISACFPLHFIAVWVGPEQRLLHTMVHRTWTHSTEWCTQYTYYLCRCSCKDVIFQGCDAMLWTLWWGLWLPYICTIANTLATYYLKLHVWLLARSTKGANTAWPFYTRSSMPSSMMPSMTTSAAAILLWWPTIWNWSPQTCRKRTHRLGALGLTSSLR